MRILLDTNIFIPLEDSLIELDEKLAELNRLVSGKHQLLIHPDTILDINRDKDSARKARSLSRLAKYTELESPPEIDSVLEVSLFGIPKKDNDTVDNKILFALHSNCVHWLLTEDGGMHKKAKRISEEERVLTVDQAIQALSSEDQENINLYPNIQGIPCHSLNLSDTFFDSLRDGYSGFDEWYQNQCSKTGRNAWVWLEDGKIQAICIYKIENGPIVNSKNQGLRGKTLKLCTFKVLKRGYKIGELLLKQAFNYTIENNYRYVYLTVEPVKHKFLEELLHDYGFYQFGTDNNDRDHVYIKEFPAKPPQSNNNPLEYAIKYYPFIKLQNNSVFLIPIKPQYHKVLFPELEKQPDFFTSEVMSAGNAIKQAYLCKSPTKSIEAGDILFFYRTTDDKVITTYGIVDKFYIEKDPEKIFQWVSKRTVYSMEEIKAMDGKEVKVILFRFIRHLNKNIPYKNLLDIGIINGPIQSITKLNKKTTGQLFNEAGINDSTLFD